MIPDVATCFQLMERYRMLPNIMDHSLVVGRVAGLIGLGLQRQGLDVSIELIVAGALLHDIAKTQCLGNGANHADQGRTICLGHGFTELADIVAEHVVLKDGVAARFCTEKEIVYYADKRVKHDQVVSLGERLDYILEQYGKGDDRLCRLIRENFDHSRQIEEKIFQHLNFGPAELGGLVNCHSLELGKIRL